MFHQNSTANFTIKLHYELPQRRTKSTRKRNTPENAGNRPFPARICVFGCVAFSGALCSPLRGRQNTPENATHPKTQILGTVDYLPCPSFPCFFGIPCFFPCEDFLAFLSDFAFFSRDFRGSVEIKNPCFFDRFPGLFPKNKERKDRVRFRVCCVFGCSLAACQLLGCGGPLTISAAMANSWAEEFHGWGIGPAPHRVSRALRARNPGRVRKEYPGAGPQRCPRVRPGVSKKPEKSLKESKTWLSDSFETPGRTLWALLGPCPGVLFSDSSQIFQKCCQTIFLVLWPSKNLSYKIVW